MHYIRFLKPPRLVSGLSPPTLTAKITITTDLGESFLFYELILLVEFEAKDRTKVGKGIEYAWKGQDGMRSIEIKIPVPPSLWKSGMKFRMRVLPKAEIYAVDSFQAALGEYETPSQGGVLAVRSMEMDADSSTKAHSSVMIGMAERLFKCGNTQIRIWEETGESIARHIWDAGLILSSYLAHIHRPENTLPKLPNLRNSLSRENLRVMELGAGCGIVGITLSTFLAHPQILLTDLPEAVDILTHNLALSPAPKSTHQVLDWSEPLPCNVQTTKWDIVVVADCTYNPDVVPDLVKTLGEVAEGNRELVVLLAMKVRHQSEMVFFKLMDGHGWVVDEKAVVPLPVLGAEDEEIEIYVFRWKL